ncbi:MAG: site-2 protease family protein [Anaerolineales bacterium]|jgi:Zn-dependent protease
MLFAGLNVATIISNIFVLIVAFTFHEFAHAWVADRFGDDTPRLHGRLTLNPIVHLDVFGSLMLIVAGFGWAKPVPINPYALRKHSNAAPMLVALAGPMSNLLLAVLAAIPFQLGLLQPSFPTGTIPTVSMVLTQFIFINLVLMLFNLIPIAPLDGDKILDYFLPAEWSLRLDAIRPYGMMILLALIFLGPYIGLDLLGTVLGPPLRSIFTLLVG